MNNRFFDISDPPSSDSRSKKCDSFQSKYLLAHYEKLSNIKELGRLPEKEEFFFLQTENSFNAFTFIPAVVERYSVRHLYAATYSINKRVIRALIELYDCGKLEQITLCISDSLVKRNPKTVDVLSGYVKTRPNIKVLFAWTHAKVAMMETDSGDYVIEGSGNWSENAHYEQYLFANCRGLLEFRKKMFTEVNVRYELDQGELRSY